MTHTTFTRRTVGLLAAALVAGACSSGGEDVARISAPVEAPSEEADEFSDAFPLTGEPTNDPKSDQPVVAVKIDNSPAARPHAGIESADIVYEEIVEGGITRFAALFHSELPTNVGPVRSARLVDIDILGGWSSILIYSGARGDVSSALAAADKIGLYPDSGAPVYSRERGRPGSHDLMADLVAALEAGRDLDDAAAAPITFTFDALVPAGGDDGEALEVRMASATRTSWEYDPEEGVYRRSQNGEPTAVVGDGRVGAANVVVILTDVGPGGCCDTAGSRFTATRFDGTGDAVVLRDGNWYDVAWSKGSETDHLELRTIGGEVFPLRPGPTWIMLAPIGAAERPEPTATESES